MGKLLHAIILGLIGAGIVHAATIIMLPLYGGQDILTKLAALDTANRFAPLEPDVMRRSGLQPADPNVRMAACRFSITEAPMRLTASGNVPFWSVSVFDARGVNLYSINDRSRGLGAMDLLIADPLQLIELRKTAPSDVADAIVFERDMDRGFAILRVMQHEESWAERVNRFLASARCETYVITEDSSDSEPSG